MEYKFAFFNLLFLSVLSLVSLASYFMLIFSILCDTLRSYVLSFILRCDIVLTIVLTLYSITRMLTTNRPQTEMLQAKYTCTYVFT